MVNRRLVNGVDKVVGREVFREGCAYGRSKRKEPPAHRYHNETPARKSAYQFVRSYPYIDWWK